MCSLFDLPLDVFGEIARRLHPIDMVALQEACPRSSRQRKVFTPFWSFGEHQQEIDLGYGGLKVLSHGQAMVLCSEEEGVLHVLTPKQRILAVRMLRCGRAAFVLMNCSCFVYLYRVGFTRRFVKVGKWRWWSGRKIMDVSSVKSTEFGLWIGVTVLNVRCSLLVLFSPLFSFFF